MKAVNVDANRVDTEALKRVIQKEIDNEIKLRTNDLEAVEENIFLCKKNLLKLRQVSTHDFYKQKFSKENVLQYPHHPAVKDTFLGKRPRQGCQSSEPVRPELKDDGSTQEKRRKKKKSSKLETPIDSDSYEQAEKHAKLDLPKPPCYIPPKPALVEPIKPPEPRGYESQREVRIIVGNVSKCLSPEEGEKATHKWTVYAKCSDPTLSLSQFISKVVFFLDSSYKPNDIVTITSSPFKLTRRGWGEFPIKARFFFKNELNTPIDVTHMLKLDHKCSGREVLGAETSLVIFLRLTDNVDQYYEESYVEYFDSLDNVPEDPLAVPSDSHTSQIKEEYVECDDELTSGTNENSRSLIKNIVCDSLNPEFNSTENISIKEEPQSDNEYTANEQEAHYSSKEIFIKSEPCTSNIFSDPDPFECLNVENSVDVIEEEIIENVSEENEIISEEVEYNGNVSVSENLQFDKTDVTNFVEMTPFIEKETQSIENILPSINEQGKIKMCSMSAGLPGLHLLPTKAVSQTPVQQGYVKLISAPEVQITNNSITLKDTRKPVNPIKFPSPKSSEKGLNLSEVISDTLPIHTSLNQHKKSENMKKTPDSSQSKQLNTIEFTDNHGKTLAAGVIPVTYMNVADPKIKIVSTSLNPASLTNILSVPPSNLPKKVLVRKLNGDIKTIMTSVTPNNVANKNSQTIKITQIKDLNNLLGLDHKVNSPQKVNVLLNKGNVNIIARPIITQSSLPSSSSMTIDKVKMPSLVSLNHQDKTITKDSKPAVIMLQKENGQVILHKEAKLNSTSLKRQEKIARGALPINIRTDGKETETPCNAVVSYLYNQNNLSCLIKSQPLKNSNLDTSGKDGKKTDIKLSSVARLRVNTFINTPNQLVNQNDSKLRPELKASLSICNESYILSMCPTATTEFAVNWLMKRYPLVSKDAALPGFRIKHSYCARSRKEFLSWPFGKQRAAEMGRATVIYKILKNLNSIKEKWTKIQIYDWARTRGFTPLPIKRDQNIGSKSIDSAEGLSDASETHFFYEQPTSDILKCIKSCRDICERETVDVCGLNRIPGGPKSFVSSEYVQFKYKLPPEKENSLFEPELVGLKEFINWCEKRVGAITAPEMLAPGVTYPAAERVLISAFLSLAEDIIRRSYSASYIRNNCRASSDISKSDVKEALVSRPEFDVFLLQHIQKKEQPHTPGCS